MNRRMIYSLMTKVQGVYREELIDSLCEQAEERISDSFRTQEHLWNRIGIRPRVSCTYEQPAHRLTVEYSMIFRTPSGTIHKPLTKNRIYCDAMDRIRLDQMQLIFEVWTSTFISYVEVAIQASRTVH